MALSSDAGAYTTSGSFQLAKSHCKPPETHVEMLQYRDGIIWLNLEYLTNSADITTENPT